MKKYRIAIVSMLLCSLFAGCGKSEPVNPSMQNNTPQQAQNNTPAPEADDDDSEAEVPEEEDTTEPEDEETKADAPGLENDITPGASDDGWKAAYLEVIDNMNPREDYVSVSAFSCDLIYLDDDDIPEMYFAYSYWESPSYGGIYTYRNGKAELTFTFESGDQFYSYKERSGDLAVYRMYSLVDDILFYHLGDTKEWKHFKCEYGEPSCDYYIDGGKKSEAQYAADLSAALDGYKPIELLSPNQLISRIETGTVSTAEEIGGSLLPGLSDTKFLICKDAVTWEQAEKLCEERGGHLAYIKTDEDFKAITAELAKTGLKFVWVGAKSETAAGVTFGRWIDNSAMTYVYDNSLWFDGEPSGWDRTSDYYTPEPDVMLWYVKDKWSFNDNSEAALDAYKPEYIGYICEFDSVSSGVGVE